MNIAWWHVLAAFLAGGLLMLILSSIIQRRSASGTIRIVEQKGEEPVVFLELGEEIREFSQRGLVHLRVEKHSYYEN